VVESNNDARRCAEGRVLCDSHNTSADTNDMRICTVLSIIPLNLKATLFT